MARHPLDHNRSGSPGGSLPFEERGLDDLYAEARALGIKVDYRASRRTLGEAVARARAEQRKAAADRARAVAASIRARWPEKAAEIDSAVEDLEAGRRDTLTITGQVRYRLEKFEGDPTPGQTPYEVIEGEDTL